MNKPYINRFLFVTLSLALLQQVIVASSSFWLVSTTKALEDSKPFKLSLLLYVVSLLLPYLPGAAAAVSLQNWIAFSQSKFTFDSLESLFGKIHLWSSDEHRARKAPVIVKEGPAWIDGVCNWIFSLTDSFLNFSLNILTLAILIRMEFLLAFLTGVALSALVIFAQRVRMEKLSGDLESKRVELTHNVQNFWDNVLIGNQINQHAWVKRSHNHFQNFIRNVARFESFNQLISLALAMCSNAPIFIYFFYLITRSETSNVEILSMVILLPRVFQIVNSSHFFLWQLTQVGAFRAREKFIYHELKNVANSNLMSRIDFKRIVIKGQSFTADGLLKELPLTGRLTVTGPNGVGKSTLLMMLKSKLEERAYFLPARFDFVFESQALQGSTGERLSQTFDILLANVNSPRILLLDEWDANLDSENTSRLNRVIDQLALDRLIVEVRHSD